MLSIHTNYTSLLTQNNLNKTSASMDQAMQRISTGFRVNSASDDAAGLQIATRLQSQVNGLSTASRNSQDAVSMLQTAEGAFDEMTNIGHRMKDLATQAANGTNSTDEHTAMQAEWNQLVDELDSIVANTQFGSGNNLFAVGGQFDGQITFQIGASTNETLTIDVSEGLGDIRDAITALKGIDLSAAGGWTDANGDVFTDHTEAAAAGWDIDEVTSFTAEQIAQLKTDGLTDEDIFNLDTRSGAAKGMDSVDELLNGGGIKFTTDDSGDIDGSLATSGIGALRSELGATINRLDHTVVNLGNMRENTEMAKGRIMDTDYAVESSNMMKNQMLTQMSMSMLSQANGMSGMVMSLI
ncbi:flagellin N-terminal helical domain-containing protein [Vibrio agarivorans]|uniref:flagellin N-terminal helical domain-containing protein n=1 Tax=Vibrio agarivorans TaxID=153622 RepID=UPI0025B394A3|nr:flagellin [Vibrio agarivorans]MDN3662112.1 flagellin [Vibrio agarivorans]